MQEKFFEVAWAAICALLTTWFLKILTAGINPSAGIFSSVYGFIHSLGPSAGEALFWTTFSLIFLLYLLTGVNKEFGRIILYIIGIIALVWIISKDVGTIFFSGYAIHWLSNQF